MEVEELYPHLFDEDVMPPSPGHLHKRQLVSSPQFVRIFPKFRCAIDKKFRGLVATSINDSDEQVVEVEEGESQEWWDEDDFGIDDQETKKVVTQEVEVICRLSSIIVDGVEFATASGIRSVEVVHGVDEDSLVVLFHSGFMVLMRLFVVDSDTTATSVGTTGDTIFKPFVVQWWQADGAMSVCSHTGAVIVVGVGWWRLHRVKESPNGIRLEKHTNVGVEGMILNLTVTCSPELLVVSLVYNDYNRLALILHHPDLTSTMLPLSTGYTLPVFFIAHPTQSLVLSVGPSYVELVDPHHIHCGDSRFPSIKAPWHHQGFPTSYYIDESDIYIATDAGVVFSVTTTENTVDFVPVIHIPDSISTFSLREIENSRYQFIYGSDTDGNKELELELLPQVAIPDALGQIEKTKAVLRKNWTNWTPILDIAVIPSYPGRGQFPPSSQELWGLTGTDNRTRLTQFRRGGTLDIVCGNESLKRTLRLFPVASGLICSSATTSVVVSVEDGLTVSEQWDFYLMYAGVVDGSLVKVAPSFIDWGEAHLETSSVFATIFNGYLITVNDHNQVMWYRPDLSIVDTMVIPFQVSCIKSGPNHVYLGTFEGVVVAYTGPKSAPDTIRIDTCYSDRFFQLNNLMVVSDIMVLGNDTFVGTSDGYLITLSTGKCLRLSDGPLSFAVVGQWLVVAGRGMWMVSPSSPPRRMYFSDEKLERNSSQCVAVGNQLAIIRDDGVVVATPSFFVETVIRQAIVGERAAKFIYVDYLSIFLVLSKSTTPQKRIKVIDRKLLKQAKINHRRGPAASLFFDSEVPLCASVWQVDKGNRISHKVVIGGKSGMVEGFFKVVDIVRHREGNQVHVSIDELKSMGHTEPIVGIKQVGEILLVLSGKSIYQTTYDDGRIHKFSLLKRLPSRVTSVLDHQGRLLVTTESDSLLQFQYKIDHGEMTVDTVSKARPPDSFINQAPLGNMIIAGDKFHAKVTVFDDETNTKCHIQVGGIPRVFTGKFSPCWCEEDVSDTVVGVDVSGGIWSLSMNPAKVAPLHRQFANKVTGTGLFDLNQIEFGWRENIGLAEAETSPLMLA